MPYQSYVFLDFREIYATADKGWDRLCDHLAGRGVPSLDDALIAFELMPLHNALKAALDPALIRMCADAAEIPPATATAAEKKPGKKQTEFLDAAWGRCEELLPLVHSAWARYSGERRNLCGLRAPSRWLPCTASVSAALLRLTSVEALMPEPWAAAARRVLPAVSPEVEATALWGPVMGWCLLELLAEAVDGDNIPRTALDLFDRLRLREPLAQAFQAMGLEGEEGWRAAARIKILLLLRIRSWRGCRVGERGFGRKPARLRANSRRRRRRLHPKRRPLRRVARAARERNQTSRRHRIPAALWQDPDVRWLTGYNEAEGHAYVNREQYAELLWWLSLPNFSRWPTWPEPRRAAASGDQQEHRGGGRGDRKGRIPRGCAFERSQAGNHPIRRTRRHPRQRWLVPGQAKMRPCPTPKNSNRRSR